MREEQSLRGRFVGRSPAEWFVLAILGFLLSALTCGLAAFAVDEVRLATDGVTRSAQVVESYPKQVTARLDGTTTVVDLIDWRGQPAPGSKIQVTVVASRPSIGQQQGVLPWFQSTVFPAAWVVLTCVFEAVWRGPRSKSTALARRVADRFGLDWFEEPLPKAAGWVSVRGRPEQVDGRAFRVLRADRQFDMWAAAEEIYRLSQSGELTVLRDGQQRRVYGVGEWLEVQVHGN